MNDMLDYLERRSFTFKYTKSSGYAKTVLTYRKSNGIMYKRVVEFNRDGSIKSDSTREKAFGGDNARDLFGAMKKAVIKKAKEIAGDDKFMEELRSGNVFLED